MKAIFENKIINKFLNIPIIWNTAQNIVGANQWKADLYPSVIAKKSGTLLDFGCSSGNETAAFIDFDYYGLDVDEVAIEGAKAKFAQFPNVKFFRLDIIKDGFKEDFFDHILFAGTGHHLTDSEVRRILDILMVNLKKGGTLHFFDIIRQPSKDNLITKYIINSDQGKNVRTEEIYKEFFDPTKYEITKWSMCPSPDRLIKLPDMLYVEIIK